MLINHRRRAILSFFQKVIRIPVLILVIYPIISSFAAPVDALNLGHDLSIISEEIEALDEIIKASSVLLENLPRNVLALKHKRVTYYLQNICILTPGLGPMAMYLLRWQVKVQRLIATAISLEAHSTKLSLC